MQRKYLALSMCILMLCSIFTVVFEISAVSAASSFGQTVKGSLSAGQPAGGMIASRFVCTSSGVASSISVYLKNPGGYSDTVKCAIYSESSKMLVASTVEKSVSGGSEGWVTFSFASGPTLTSGSSYSLVAWFKRSYVTAVSYSSGGSSQSWYARPSYDGVFSSGPYTSLYRYGQESIVYSIYCTVGSSSSPSPTPTPTPTPTATQTPSSGDRVEIIRSNYATYSLSAKSQVTNFDLMIGHWDAVESLLVPAKELRSDFTALLYYNSLMVYSTGNNNPSGTFTTFKNNGWLLKDTSGRYVTDSGGSAYFVDFGNPAVHNYFANWISGIVDTYDLDGIQMDNTCFDTEAFYYATTYNVVNPRTGSVWTDSQVVNAYISYINTIQNKMGYDKIILCNGVYNGYHFERDGKHENILKLIAESNINGIMSEGWLGAYSPPWISEDAWLSSIDMAVWMQDNLLARKVNGVFMAICPWASTNPDISGSLNGVPLKQYVSYCYASMLLAAEYPGNSLFFGATDSYTQALFNIDVGVSVGNYYKVSNTHVYAKDYSNAKVLVNPSTSSYTVSLSGSYVTQDGVYTGSSITVPAHSGLILEKV